LGKVQHIRISTDNLKYIEDNPELITNNKFLLEDFKYIFGIYLINYLRKMERKTKYSIPIGL